MTVCTVCGCDPCRNPAFCASCATADARKAHGESPRYIEPSSERQAKSRQSNATWRDGLITAKALQTKTFAPVRIIVPGLIPEGVTILAGKPKIGKSWLALDICAAVAADRFVLGETKPVQGDAFTSRSKTINGG